MMKRILLIVLFGLGQSFTIEAQNWSSPYKSVGVIGNIPLHFGDNHFAKDLNLGYGLGVNFRLPIYQFGITGQWQTSYHAINDDAQFIVNARQMRNRLYSLFFGYSHGTAYGTFEPRLNVSRLISRYLSDYKNKQLLCGIGLKYGLALGSDGFFITSSIDYVTNASNQIVAPEHFSKYMNQSQSLLINVGLEWRFAK